MSVPSPVAEKLYRAYLQFLEIAEKKRRWSIFEDIPWTALDRSKNSEDTAATIETFCAEELYLPDYSVNGIGLTRSIFGAAWFQACWSYEESKHGLVFREYLTRSGLRSEADFASFEAHIFSRRWRLPFRTRRQMACYGALQEIATYLAYKAQKEKAEREGDKVREAIFFFVSRDEAAHATFYREAVKIEMANDRRGTLADLAFVTANFKMPGDGLIPYYRERLRSSGAGITPRTFVARGLLPTLRMLGTSRTELRTVLASSGRSSRRSTPSVHAADVQLVAPVEAR